MVSDLHIVELAIFINNFFKLQYQLNFIRNDIKKIV